MLGLQVVETAVAVGGAYFFMPKNPDLKDPVLRVSFYDMLSLCELVKCMVRRCPLPTVCAMVTTVCHGAYYVLWCGSAQLQPLHFVTVLCMLFLILALSTASSPMS